MGLIAFWFMTSVTVASKDTDDLLTNLEEALFSSRHVLEITSQKVTAHKEWFKDYQAQFLSSNSVSVASMPRESISRQLNEIWEQIEALEHSTKSNWLENLSKQLDSETLAQASAEDIRSWIEAQSWYISQLKEDLKSLELNIEQVKEDYVLPEIPVATSIEDIEKNIEALEVNVPTNITSDIKANDALEASLIYLLGGLEIWGQWLDPANEIGLLPEAEGRFMLSNTPILQAGSTSISGGIGVVGFAQPIIISHDGVPRGFSEEISEPLPIDFNDSIEDVFQKVPYHDRLIYQYGVAIDGRSVQIYRKSIETELTLSIALQRMGASPEIAEAWVEEYAEMAYLPQTIQLSWLIAGNPLAKDYKLHTENLLAAFDTNALFTPSNQGEFTLPQAPNPEWVNEDPFWAEVQNQPFLKAFTDLLSGASEEIQRSFIVSLFFLESSLPVVRSASSNTVTTGVSLRQKPFFWSDEPEADPSSSATTPQAAPVGSIDPDQARLVAKALQQRANLIHYWVPGQGDQLITWSERELLNPNKGAPYFIIAATALPQFEPETPQETVQKIVNEHLPTNQPVFKLFMGMEAENRRVIDAKGTPVPFADTNLVWSAESLDNDAVMQYVASYQIARKNSYVAIQFDNGPFLAGSFTQLRRLLQGRQNYTIETIVLRSKGTTNYQKRILKNQAVSDLRANETWLNYATRVSADVFSWLPQKQDELLVQSTHRKAVFKRNSDLRPEIKTSTMVKWPTLPSNETLLAERVGWNANAFLIEVEDGYFLISPNELEHLQKYADETPKVHSLLLSAVTELNHEYINSAVRAVLPFQNLNCDSVRVLSAGGVDLAYNSQCSIVIADSGRELAQAGEPTLLAKARKHNQPIVIFRPEDKPASALPLRTLVDADSDSIEKLSVGTLVPTYDLEGLDAEEKESAIELNIADALKRTLQFFPNQSTFEVLMPEGIVSGEQKVNYVNAVPEGFSASHSFDTVNVVVPNSNEQASFYRVDEAVLASRFLELPANDIYIQNEFNTGRIFELAQEFHSKSNLPYTVVQSNKGKYYAGTFNDLNNRLPTGEWPEHLLLMVTKTRGVNNRGFAQHEFRNAGWLQTSAEKVADYSARLETDPNDVVNVWSATGKRYVTFSPEGKLQLESMIQWTSRPDNQTLKSLRQTWDGHVVLVNVPNQGYFVAQVSDGEFLESVPEAKIDTIVLGFDPGKSFSTIWNQAKGILQTLRVTHPVRVMSNSGVPTTETESVYSGLDLALKVDGNGELQVDLQHSGLELVKQSPEQWLSYAEATDLPLAIFEWPDGKKSSASFTHIKGAQNVTELKSQQIVPAYNSEDLAEVEDAKEAEGIIAIALQDTLQRALNFLPNQTSFQVVMPDGRTQRHYSQELLAENQIQAEPLGTIEVTSQYDGTKVKYYYQPTEIAPVESNNTDTTQILSLLAKQTGFGGSQYQGTRAPSLKELIEKSNTFFSQHIPNEEFKAYAMLKLSDGTYFGGPWHRIKKIPNLNDVIVDKVVIAHKGVSFAGRSADNRFREKNWLEHWAGQVANEAFTTFPQSSSLTVCARFCRRQVVFKKEENGESQANLAEVIDLAAMPATISTIEEEYSETSIQWWDHLPSDEVLLAERAKWQFDMVLMHVPALERYFWISYNEIPYFEQHTSHPIRVHTMVVSHDTKLHLSVLKSRFQRAVPFLPESNSTIRVISAPDFEIAFDRECKIDGS